MDVGDGRVESSGRCFGELCGGKEKTEEKNPGISRLGNPRVTHHTRLDAKYVRSNAFWDAGLMYAVIDDKKVEDVTKCILVRRR
jgi:hypothetical protein